MSEYVAYQYHSFVYALSPMDSSDELMRQLNELGAQGWEMISIEMIISPLERNNVRFEQPIYTAYFKRAYMAQISDQ